MQNGLHLGLANQPVQIPKRPLSPILDVCDDLGLFMRSFGKFHGLSNEEIEPASKALQDKGYSPFALKAKDLDVRRIGELTGLNEGRVLGLREFANDWVDRQTAKRARYN